jgi:hypothetical protein
MQASFDDLGTPLHQVTFCVVDIETTGGTAADGASPRSAPPASGAGSALARSAPS